MTSTELMEWQRRCGLRTDRDAAKVLAMSLSSYRAKRTNRAAITAQDELLAAYYEAFASRWPGIVDAAIKLGRLTDIPIPPAAARRTAEILAKVLDLSASRP
jgi:hypothetical protein